MVPLAYSLIMVVELADLGGDFSDLPSFQAVFGVQDLSENTQTYKRCFSPFYFVFNSEVTCMHLLVGTCYTYNTVHTVQYIE